MLDEGVVFLSRAFRERLEPVGVVRHSVLHSPLLHSLCHRIGNGTVEPCAVVHYVDELFINVARKILIHLGAVEHVFSEILRRAFGGCDCFLWFLLESLCHNLKS